MRPAVEVDKGAASRHQLFQVGGNGQYFVAVEPDFQAGFQLQRFAAESAELPDPVTNLVARSRRLSITGLNSPR